MTRPGRKWALFALRWGIAIGGIYWVVSNMSLRDRVTILDERKHPVTVELAEPAREDSSVFELERLDPETGRRVVVARRELVNRADRPGTSLEVELADGRHWVQLLALDLSDDLRRVERLLVTEPETGEGMWIGPFQVVSGYELRVPHPLVEAGILTLVELADPYLLWMAVLIFPATFIITSYRWHELLKALDVRVARTRTFVLNMVGAFYNTFMLGSTGGDLLKAYYASKQTPHRTHAVLSVVVDRGIGLMGLVVLGGAMAAYQYARSPSADDPAARASFRVALGAAGMIVAACLFLGVFMQPAVRRRLGLEFVIQRLPMQRLVQPALEVMRIFRRRWGVVLWALLVTLPVHATVCLSAMLAGKAFGLPLPAGYYFVAVPVIVLSGAIPISPQGAGVMEFFAIQLTKQYGTTVSEAFALTMSIRVVQMMWNLAGGIFVFRGGYHAPTEREQREMEEDETEPAPQPAG